MLISRAVRVSDSYVILALIASETPFDPSALHLPFSTPIPLARINPDRFTI